MHPNDVSAQIVDAALRVHTRLGPGLLESTYEACLAYELTRRGLNVACQAPLPVIYDAIRIQAGYRIDMIVADLVIVELKAVDVIRPIHRAQLLSYLRLSGKKLGLLLNFNEVRFKDGIIRLFNHL